MIWFTARIAEISAYLLLEPHPPMKRPTISIADTARKNRTPMLRSATPSPGAQGPGAKGKGGEDHRAGHPEPDGGRVVDRPIALPRDPILLHHQLERVRDGLE